MNWRVRIVSNDLSIYRWRHYPRPSLRGCRLPYPFHSKSAFFHRCSSQWTSKRRVFPIFDLGLLDSSLIEEELSTRHEPKELHTYPVGDEHVLNNRYQVLHKIGYGPTANLWQAIDLIEPRMVVLKIYVVEHVLKTYGRLHPPPVFRKEDCPLHQVKDRFTIEGPHGPHICVVHEAPDMDLEQMHSGEKLDIESIRSTMKQMLIMLDFLHTDCYLTARIHPGKSLSSVSNHERAVGLSDDLVAPMILPGDGIPLTIDAQDDDKSGIEEKHSRSPEEVLKSQCNHKTDIWHVASYAWGSASSEGLINGRNSDGAFDDRVHIAELVALLGPPPPSFQDKMRLGSMFWDKEGKWTGQAPIPERSLESLATAGNVEGENLKGFLQWMRKAMQWDPDDRPTALGLLRHEWMSQKAKNPEDHTQDSKESP